MYETYEQQVERMSEEIKEFSWSKLDPKWNKLVEDHWGYVKKVIEKGADGYSALDTRSEMLIDTIGWHYKGAMLHGIKHALENPRTVTEYTWDTYPVYKTEYVVPYWILCAICAVVVFQLILTRAAM